ncbi:MAG TPA: DUF6768 family protein [Balneolaceae bacterium]|nr:DUF6768 family protein [Balneolaceae bacterium]
MKNEQEIDRLISESLNKEEAEFYASLEEEGLPQKVKSLYSGKFGRMAVLTAIVHTIAVGIAVYCGYKLFTSPDVVEILRYSVVLFIAWSFGIMIKLWQWMQMDKESVMREMKRLEFQVAVLMEKKSDRT